MSDATQDPQPIVPTRREFRAKQRRPARLPICGEWSRFADVEEVHAVALELVRYRLRWVASELHRWTADMVRRGARPDEISEKLRVIVQTHSDLLEKQFERVLTRIPTLRLEPRPDGSFLAFERGVTDWPATELARMPVLCRPATLKGPRDE